MSEECPTEKPNWGQTRTLYVVLQGEFALYQQPADEPDADDTLRIVAPYVEGHSYKAGPWLSNWKDDPKTDLSWNKLQLRNVIGDHKQYGKHRSRSSPEHSGDILVELGEEQPCPDGARVDISVPMPLAILTGLVETTPSVFITVTERDGSISHPPVAAEPTVIPILVYKWYEGCRPDLYDTSSGCTWSCGGPSEYFQSIHIYASSLYDDAEHSKEHAQEAFCKASKLLGVTAKIDWKDDPSLYQEIYAVPPAGLSWAQINLFLWQVQMLQQQNPCDPALTQDDQPPDLPFNKLSGSGNCGPIGGGTGG